MKFSLVLFTLIFQFQLTPAQQKQNLDSILKHYSEKNEKIDSLVGVSHKEKGDTLKVHALARLYNTFLYNTPDLSKRFAVKELEVSRKIGFKKGVGWSLYHIGAYFQNSSNIDSARYYYRKALKIYEGSKYRVEYASTLNSIGDLEFYEGNDDEALKVYDEAMSIYENISKYQYAITLGSRANIFIKKGNYKIALTESLKSLRILDTIDEKPLRKADALRLVGQIEFFRENFDNSLKYFIPALDIYTENEDNLYQANVGNDIGNTYYYMGDYDKALVYLTASLDLAKKYNISDTEGDVLSNLGKVYSKKGQYDKALEHLNAALLIHQKNRYKTNILFTQNEIGNTYLAKGEPKKAIPFLSNTVKSADVVGPINELKNAYQIRALAYRETGQLENAISDQFEFQRLNDSIFNTTKAQQIEELRTIYETEKKEQEIVLQKNEIDLLEQKAEISNLQRILLGVGFLLSFIGFYAVRQKLKRKKLEKEKVDIELAFKKKELTTHALHLAKKNEVLEGLKQKAEEFKATENGQNGYQQLIRTINFDLQDDNNWENFSKYFQEVHKDFNGNVKQKFPEVTSNELRLMALLKMNLSSKEIANILNISLEGIKKARYRLRKKLEITSEESLQDLVLGL